MSESNLANPDQSTETGLNAMMEVLGRIIPDPERLALVREMIVLYGNLRESDGKINLLKTNIIGGINER